MSDFLTRLILAGRGQLPTVRPRLPTVFEPAQPAAMGFPVAAVAGEAAGAFVAETTRVAHTPHTTHPTTSLTLDGKELTRTEVMVDVDRSAQLATTPTDRGQFRRITALPAPGWPTAPVAPVTRTDRAGTEPSTLTAPVPPTVAYPPPARPITPPTAVTEDIRPEPDGAHRITHMITPGQQRVAESVPPQGRRQDDPPTPALVALAQPEAVEPQPVQNDRETLLTAQHQEQRKEQRTTAAQSGTPVDTAQVAMGAQVPPVIPTSLQGLVAPGLPTTMVPPNEGDDPGWRPATFQPVNSTAEPTMPDEPVQPNQPFAPPARLARDGIAIATAPQYSPVAEPTPVIRVTIGRIDVRAVQADPPPVARPAARLPDRRLSLEAYLQQSRRSP